MEELQDFSEQKESNFDLKAEIFKYLAYWKWLLLGFLVGGFIAYLYNRYTIPKYYTEASLMILSDGENNVASALPSGGGSILQFGDKALDNEIVTLKSKRLIGKVVDDLNLNVSYYMEGNFITPEVYKSSPVIINFFSPDSVVNNTSRTFLVSPISKTKFKLVDESNEYSEIHQMGDVIRMDDLSFAIEYRSLDEVSNFVEAKSVQIQILPLDFITGLYISELLITPKGKAMDILSLGIIQEVSRKSEDFLNNLMYQFNVDGVSDKRQVASSTTKFIQERLELITSELDSVEGGLADFKKENKFMDVGSGAEEFLSKSSKAESKMFDLELQLEIIRSIENILNSREDFKLLPSNLGIEAGGIGSLISNYNTLVLERNAYLKSATVENPAVEIITTKLNSLKENLRDNIVAAKQTINIELGELNQLDQVAQSKFSTFPGMEKGMRGIVRQQEIKEQLYLFLLQRREEAAIAFAVTSPVAKIVDPAYTYPNPVDPESWLILLIGFLVGLLIPLLILFTRFMLDTKVHHKGDLAPLIKNVPFIGEVPRISTGAEEIIQLNDRSPLAESFRILRTNLAYLVKNKKDNKGEIIFVTSTIKGEGKTFISYNLARTLATSGKKVIIIGADIRNPKLHRYTGTNPDKKGLSDYLYDHDISIPKIISPSLDQEIKVDVIQSGVVPPNPAELFMNDRMELLLKELSTNYDFIIVDTAPTMIVTDTLLISPLADTTLYITRAGYTEKKLLDFPKDLKQQGKLKGLAIILNDVDYSKFSYGAKYGYAYGYGYGYGADEESKFAKIIKKPFKSTS